MFSHGVVDGHHRKLERTVLGHSLQPNHTGGGFLGATHDFTQLTHTFLVQCAHQVRSIIHGDSRMMVESSVKVAVIGLVVLAFDSIDRDLVMHHQRCGHIILGGERVGGTDDHIRAAGLQGAH